MLGKRKNQQKLHMQVTIGQAKVLQQASIILNKFYDTLEALVTFVWLYTIDMSATQIHSESERKEIYVSQNTQTYQQQVHTFKQTNNTVFIIILNWHKQFTPTDTITHSKYDTKVHWVLQVQVALLHHHSVLRQNQVQRQKSKEQSKLLNQTLVYTTQCTKKNAKVDILYHSKPILKHKSLKYFIQKIKIVFLKRRVKRLVTAVTLLVRRPKEAASVDTGQLPLQRRQ